MQASLSSRKTTVAFLLEEERDLTDPVHLSDIFIASSKISGKVFVAPYIATHTGRTYLKGRQFILAASCEAFLASNQ